MKETAAATGFVKDKTRWSSAGEAIARATPDDAEQGVVFALTNSLLTGQTPHFDGGEPLT